MSLAIETKNVLEVDQSNATCKVCCSTLKDRPSMNYTFYINTGHFIGGSGEWAIDTYGYSGNSNQKGEVILSNCD